MKIYVASSWRNENQPAVVKRLRLDGHEVYDFRNSQQVGAPSDNGFRWEHIDANWNEWSVPQFIDAMDHPMALEAFEKDMRALISAELLVLVMPCGRSAHLEMGYAVGSGIPTVILLSDGEPELMYKMASAFAYELDELVQLVKDIEAERLGFGRI